MSGSEICDSCGAVVKLKDVHWGEKFVCRASMSGPAEYDEVPLCYACFKYGDARAEAMRDAALEKQWEERTGR